MPVNRNAARIAIIVLVILFVYLIPVTAAERKQPNIIFILVDDLRYDAPSIIGGYPFVTTPSIDRIGREGVIFSNAFVSISLCSPSRACFLTGLYAHTHGVTCNDDQELDPAIPTYPRILRDNGYETAFIGKWHMRNDANPRPGFDYWLSFKGQGIYNNPPLNENGRDFNTNGYMTDILNEYALSWLKKPRTKPFCLYLSHKAVHQPFTPPVRHKDLYAGERFDKPASFDDTFEGKPAWQRGSLTAGGRDKVPPSIPPIPWNGNRQNELDYMRVISAVDEGIAQIMDLLEKQKVLDDTIIVFAGDNGYFWGEHRRMDKRLAYEESIRIPLFVRYPRAIKPGSRVSEMVLNIDLAPTLLDYAGVKAERMQGMSWRPLAEGKSVPWRSSFLYEYYVDLIPSIPMMLGIRTPEWKYIRYPEIEDIDEMYSIGNDPYELTNLALLPAYSLQAAKLRTELEQLLKTTDYKPLQKPKPTEMPAQLALNFTFDDAGKAVDVSGNKNDGKCESTVPVEGHNGTALRFNGNNRILVERSESLSPKDIPLSMELWIKPEKPNGIILSRGGASQGYAIVLENGVLRFLYRVNGMLQKVETKDKISSEWTHIAAVITGGREMKLYVNGTLAGSASIRKFITADPNEGLEIGADSVSPVGDYKNPPGFSGLIDEVKVYRGELSAQEIRRYSPGAHEE